MVAATVLFEGAIGDTAGIIAAVGTNAFSTLAFIPSVNGQGLLIMKQGS